jgi:glycosyltransferase involved in cell wall biosynthesis
MPQISLVACIFRQSDLLDRLLRNSVGCYDEALIIHDGPDDSGVAQVAHQHGARFVERPRQYTHEPHWPFAWGESRNDWILLLDADEFPGEELVTWLKQFRDEPEPATEISGYTCDWPLWNGRRAVTNNWPGGRIFLINRRRVRYFGMGENRPDPDGYYKALPLTLHHQPHRKSYGIRNILLRKSAYHWRRRIAESLMGVPTDLPCWRWSSQEWPPYWENVRSHPLRHSLSTLIRYPLRQLRGMVRAGQRPILSACLNPGLHHAMLGLRVFVEMRRRKTSTP